MYAAVPGKTGLVAVRLETVGSMATKPVQKQALPAPKSVCFHDYGREVIDHAPCVCSSKGGPDSRAFRREDFDPDKFGRNLVKEHRKSHRAHLHRRDTFIFR